MNHFDTYLICDFNIIADNSEIANWIIILLMKSVNLKVIDQINKKIDKLTINCKKI